MTEIPSVSRELLILREPARSHLHLSLTPPRHRTHSNILLLRTSAGLQGTLAELDAVTNASDCFAIRLVYLTGKYSGFLLF